MVTIMNQYIEKIVLQTDAVTKGIIEACITEQNNINKYSIQSKSNRFIIDIQFDHFDITQASMFMNTFIQNCAFHYSSYYLRFNEGNCVRYRFATCKENKEGYYCDIVIR